MEESPFLYPELGIEERYQFICPKEGCNLVQEIISTHTDIGKIVLRCANNHLMELDVEDYFKILNEKKYEGNTGLNNIDNDLNNEIFTSHEIIMEKIKELSKIIEFNKMNLNEQEKNPLNFLYCQNIINLGKFFEEENSSFFKNYNNTGLSYKITDIVKQELINNKEKEEDSIKKLENDFCIFLNPYYKQKGFSLKLRGEKDETKYRWLRDEGFELISNIRFKNLIELNLSNNGITNLTPIIELKILIP